MSIPKEPRQLMINLMYIVLTALLALNVSAEILNAFLTMDKGIVESSEIVGKSNLRMLAAINQQAEAYSQFAQLSEKANKAESISAEFYNYVSNLKQEIIDKSGGLDEIGLPKGKKDKDITTRMLVEEGKGVTLEKKIKSLRSDLLALIDDEQVRRQLEQSIPLNIKPVPADSDKKSWAEFNFYQMPVAAILPLLSKFQNDAKITETTILDYFLRKTDVTIIKPDAFKAVVSADKSYVIKGEELTTEIFLAAYSSTADNISIMVNGRSYPVVDGKAVFKTRPETVGTKDIDVMVNVTDPITGKVSSYPKKFIYEVGERSVTIAADKMNVFYVGVENPISVSAAGIPSNEMRVTAEGVNIYKINNGKYIAKSNRPGIAKITVSGGGLKPTTFEYRVKPIPTPIPMLGDLKSGSISIGRLKTYKGIRAVLENFDFNAKCNIVSFEMTRLPKFDDPRITQNIGGDFNEEAKRIIKKTKHGDIYYFDNIRAKCPGDTRTRKLNGMVFRIK
jgi:gliding motility-associated protein GldM